MTRVTFFAFDIAEAAQIRRIESIQSLGVDVTSVSFRRSNMNEGFNPHWPDLPLGFQQNNAFLRRGFQAAKAVFKVMRKRAVIADSAVWVARNIDMLAIAWAVKTLLVRRRVKLVYECLDIHSLFTKTGPVGATMRWIERRLLDRIDLLVISSPAFERCYFSQRQTYSGAIALIENKLWLGEAPMPRPAAPRRPKDQRVLGWVGSLRCPDSLRILAGAADAMGAELQIRLHGNVHHHALPDFDDIVSRRPNMTYHGPYDYPHDLGPIYTACDLVWAQDLWQRGGNSDWLLPNRIYEASYYGCPSIAVAGMETGRRVAEGNLGITLPAAETGALVTALRDMSAERCRAASQHLLDQPDARFRLTADELRRHLQPVLPHLHADSQNNPQIRGGSISKPAKI
ncbi:MAG: glycosyl transferase [Pseudomonadota bacterium]